MIRSRFTTIKKLVSEEINLSSVQFAHSGIIFGSYLSYPSGVRWHIYYSIINFNQAYVGWMVGSYTETFFFSTMIKEKSVGKIFQLKAPLSACEALGVGPMPEFITRKVVGGMMDSHSPWIITIHQGKEEKRSGIDNLEGFLELLNSLDEIEDAINRIAGAIPPEL